MPVPAERVSGPLNAHRAFTGSAHIFTVVSQDHSLRPVLRGILLDVAPPLLAYYGLRAAGVSEYVALLTGTVLAGIKVSYDAIKARRLDPFAGYLMLNFGLSLAVGLATSDARMLMVGNTLVGGVGAVVFLGSCFIGTPLTQIIAERVRVISDESPEPGEAEFKRRVNVSLSAMWGIGLLIGTLISLAIIFSLSVDVANGVNTVVSLAFTALLMVVTVVMAKRARTRWDHLREQTAA
ncbi:uncharacterized protein RMCB_1359 [Mycolicibacterium brisbanense]|uniref:Transmembrane protein n=1 Tax=Mycolicibacterium brisbanense TaxID=146020 RepID=A0A100VWG9_9MYCO|nr:uncharacterized protein RMCB_1359 [Mycolicibacterium brisbanense]